MAEFALESFRCSDGTATYLRRYAATGRPRGRVVFVHGIRSNGGWYTGSCGRLAAAGYEVVFLDRRGAGLNTARRGDSPNFRRLLDDVAEFLLEERRSRPWLPTVLGGISWGGKLAAALPYRRPGLTAGICLLCPGLCPVVRPSFAERVGILRARLRDPDKLFPIPLNEPDFFTASPEWQQFIADDRHGLTRATARFLMSSVSLDIYLKRAVRRVRGPVLLMLGGRDRVISSPATRAYLTRFTAAGPIRVIDYPDAEHTLEFEGEACHFVPDLLTWLRGVMP